MQLDLQHTGRPAAVTLRLLLVYANAALLGHCRRIDAVHILRSLQKSFDGRVAHQFSFGIGQSAAVGHEGVVISNNGVLYGVTQSGSYNPLNAQAPPEVFSLTPQRLLAVPGPMQCYICS